MKLESFVKGEGESLLFLGGAFTTFKYYEKFINLLATNYKVYFFNYPGFGGSDPFADGHTIENYTKAIEDFIKQKDLKKFHLTGSSFGGLLAVHYAHIVKVRSIKSLILFSPKLHLQSKSKLWNAYNLARENLVEKIKFRNKSLVANAFHLYIYKNPLQMIKQASLVHECELDEKEVPKEIPILLVEGKRDKLVDVNYATTILKNKNENVEIAILEEHGHEAFAAIGDEILDIVRNFTENINTSNS
jgi:pimeloyl-ACP methyl ester carboxylesterase